MRHIWIISLLLFFSCSNTAEKESNNTEIPAKKEVKTAPVCACDNLDFKSCLEQKADSVKFRDYLKSCSSPPEYDLYVDSLCGCANRLKQVGIDCDFLVERLETKFSKAELDFISYLFEKRACYKKLD